MIVSRWTLLACVIAMRAAAAQAPAGYHIGARAVVPDSLVEVFDGGRFRSTVMRSARTPEERRLIGLAESLYPNVERLLDAAQSD